MSNALFVPGIAWFDPKTGAELDDCPFLIKISRGKYSCAIQETKPTMCREFWCAATYGLGKREDHISKAIVDDLKKLSRYSATSSGGKWQGFEIPRLRNRNSEVTCEK